MRVSFVAWFPVALVASLLIVGGLVVTLAP